MIVLRRCGGTRTGDHTICPWARQCASSRKRGPPQAGLWSGPVAKPGGWTTLRRPR